MSYGLLADLVLGVHLAFALFIVLGGLLVALGGAFGWRFVRGPRFRLAHLAALGFVLLESLAGWFCPLTRWEYRLRELAGHEARPDGSFMRYWAERLFYFHWDERTFTALYAAGFAAILLLLILVPPDWRRLGRKAAKHSGADSSTNQNH